LARCAQLAKALAAFVDVVSVVDFEAMNAYACGQLSSEALMELERGAMRAVSEATVQLGRDGIVTYGHVAVGRATDVLLRHANTLLSSR
jgi:hypothetical protein